MTKCDDIYAAVLRERTYQDKKWGSIVQHPHSIREWLAVMEKELREATDAWAESKGDDEAMKELLQVVAVGFAAMEQHGIVERQENDPRNY